MKSIANILPKFKLYSVLQPLIRFIPFEVKAWIKRKKLRELVSVAELKPQLRKSLTFLEERIGADSMGDYLEFGVCHGTSFNCMKEVLNEKNVQSVRQFGFDSFEGLPEIDEAVDDKGWFKGQFNSNFEETKYFLTRKGINWDKAFLIKGWFSDTLTQEFINEHDLKKASIIMIDCDIYSSSKLALDFCAPLIKDTTIIIFDDWYARNLAEQNKGEKKAFDEFLRENPHLEATEFGNYNFEGKKNGKLFAVTNNLAS